MTTQTLRLILGETSLEVAPALGGGVLSFDWRGKSIFRPGRATGNPLDLSCFPLVPFANRIDRGRVPHRGRVVSLTPNKPETDSEHAIHGYGWLCPWEIIDASEHLTRLTHSYKQGEWPWSYEAEQVFKLVPDGLEHRLEVINRSEDPMPVGLGSHPYFPREAARLEMSVEGIWHNDDQRLPCSFEKLAYARNWSADGVFDNVLTGVKAPITIRWADHYVSITPDENSSFVHLFTPAKEDFFCVECVSHIPNAINCAESNPATGYRVIAPGESFATTTRYSIGGEL